ncbi:6-phosphogluconolactonase [Mesorhizobium sp. CN5-321]|jgi:6-phosphogluconolactonase|uniref:6-phosphogluconolactonase n=1 Tax=Mesorhizobium hunchu TaxID=3157708 RepID=UPI0032B76BEC
MAATYHWNSFADGTALASALAGKVAGLLARAVSERGEALFAVSGGATPALFFAALSEADIAWDKVTVTLVDERFVPPSSPRSNAALVMAKLLQGKAAAARFLPLFRNGEDLDEAAADGDRAIAALPQPFDVVILGMGGDGHTASFFPDAEELPALLDRENSLALMPVHADSAGEPRLTLTLPRIVAAGFLALHIEGDEKRATFDRAMGGGPQLPIRAVLDASPRPVEVFWAP